MIIAIDAAVCCNLLVMSLLLLLLLVMVVLQNPSNQRSEKVSIGEEKKERKMNLIEARKSRGLLVASIYRAQRCIVLGSEYLARQALVEYRRGEERWYVFSFF